MPTVFQESWLCEPAFSSWLARDLSNNKVAKCKLCHKTFNLSNMGRRAVTSHMNGDKHKRNLKAGVQTAEIQCFWTQSKPPQDIETTVESHVATSSDPPDTSSILEPLPPPPPRGLQSFLLNDSVSRAEIIWSIQSVMNHSSLRATARDVCMFETMFPDSDIAKKMRLQRDKVGYLLAYGIAPYFQKELLDVLKNSEILVLGFDESLNKVAQKQQMDVNVRFWDELKKEVSTRYLTSVFLGRSRAIDLLNAFKETVSTMVDLKKILQISMDGPNVNFKFLRDFKDEIKKEPGDGTLLDIGSCGLHTMHCAFKSAMIETCWDIVGFLRALYNVLKDSPARRAAFTNVTKLTTFPKKFCGIRWCENVAVAERALDLLPHIELFIKEMEKEKSIHSKSYQIVVKHISDPLLAAKLEFFKCFAFDLEPFLRRYQTDEPLAPFLYSDLTLVIKTQVNRFVKPEVVSKAESLKDLKLTEKNLLEIGLVDIGIATRHSISKANKKYGKMKDSAIHSFRESCRKSLLKFTTKMLEKSPLKYKLTKGISAFDPKVVENFQVAKSRMDLLLRILLENNWISSSIVDKCMREYQTLCTNPNVVLAVKNYNRKIRIDKFWGDLLGSESPNLFIVLKIVCTLSHGNANIERGFSVNADCIVENMHEELLIARRCVFDRITSFGGIQNLVIEKPLIHAARNSYSRFVEAKESKKKERDSLVTEAHRKRVADLHVAELQKKKAKILEEAKREADLLNEEINLLKKQ